MRMRAVVASVMMTFIYACSGGGLTGPAPAQAIMAARFDRPDVTDCSVAGATLNVGSFADAPVPVTDGSQGGANKVSCRVAKLGNDRFDVEATVAARDRVLFAIKGTFPQSTDVKGFFVDRVTLSNGAPGPDYAAFTEADGQCTVLYNMDEQGAFLGRVWGEVTCTKATNDPALGGAGSGTCITLAHFRFENCERE